MGPRTLGPPTEELASALPVPTTSRRPLSPSHSPSRTGARRDGDLAGESRPARDPLRRLGRERGRVLRGRRAGRDLPVRRRQGDPPGPAGAERLRAPRLRATGPARPALRLPRARSVEPRRGPVVQPRQAAHRPLCPGGRRRRRVGRRRVRLPPRRRGPTPQRRRQRTVRPQERRGQPVVRLVRRPTPRHPLARDGHLRGARQGVHAAPPGHPSRPQGHLRRAAPSRWSSTTFTGSG